MEACAIQKKIVGNVPVSNLILPVPDTDFREFLDKVEEIGPVCAGNHRGHREGSGPLCPREKEPSAGRPEVFGKPNGRAARDEHYGAKGSGRGIEAGGRPRMPGYAVCVFLMICGFLASLTTKPARRFLRESMILYGFLQGRGLSLLIFSLVHGVINTMTYNSCHIAPDVSRSTSVIGAGSCHKKARIPSCWLKKRLKNWKAHRPSIYVTVL
jgi:hypothetical protein